MATLSSAYTSQRSRRHLALMFLAFIIAMILLLIGFTVIDSVTNDDRPVAALKSFGYSDIRVGNKYLFNAYGCGSDYSVSWYATAYKGGTNHNLFVCSRVFTDEYHIMLASPY